MALVRTVAVAAAGAEVMETVHITLTQVVEEVAVEVMGVQLLPVRVGLTVAAAMVALQMLVQELLELYGLELPVRSRQLTPGICNEPLY